MLSRFIRPTLVNARPALRVVGAAYAGRCFASLNLKVRVESKDNKKIFSALNVDDENKPIKLPVPTVTYSTLQQLREEANKYIIPQKVMEINGVSEVQCAPEALTVVLEDNFKWEQVEPKVTAAVEAGLKQVQKETDDHVIEAVRYLIDVKVKPVLQGDGGDIRFEGFKDGVVSVSLHGACKGCPSSVITLKQGVEKYIKTHVPQVERVDSEDEAIPVTQQEMQIRIDGIDPSKGEGESKTYLG